MIILKKSIPRRTFLRGVGAAISLPMLSAMVPAMARDGGGRMPLRVGYIYTPNGILRDTWRPVAGGSDYELTQVLKHWQGFRDQLLVLSNLNNGETASVAGHVGGSSMLLTGAEPNQSLSEIRCGISVDQLIANETGKQTPLASLQICIENAAELAGQSASGYSSAYTNTISWANDTTPLPMEHRPREIFERLFGDVGTDPVARAQRIGRQKSILDFVKNEINRVEKKLGVEDSVKLNEFTDALRDVELRVQKAEGNTNMELPELERPVGIPPHAEHIALMYDLMLLAFQTDMTRVFTFMVAREYSELVYTQLGHVDPYHPITHHRGDPTKMRQAGEIDAYHAKMFAGFLEKMRSTKDADGSSLLDNSMFVYGAGMGDGDVHNQFNIPLALIGGGQGKFKGGRHIEYREGTPVTNLHVTMLNMFDIPTEKFGGQIAESTGALDLDKSA